MNCPRCNSNEVFKTKEEIKWYRDIINNIPQFICIPPKYQCTGCNYNYSYNENMEIKGDKNV